MEIWRLDMCIRDRVNLQGQLFLLMFLGLFFKRRNILGEKFQNGLTDLVIDLLLPCSIILSFQV